MNREDKILAIIPARGGSKGLPGKNIKTLGNKPLIAWTIEASLKSIYISKTIVSSDDEEIICISKQWGADVPFVRPDYLATDDASTYEVILHSIRWFEERGEFFDYVILLQPTSPLRSFHDIDNAFNYMKNKNAKCVVSLCEVDHHPFWSNKLPENFNMEDFFDKEIINLGRQKLPKFYRVNGAIYLSDITYYLNNRGFWGKDTFALIMDRDRSVDIDDEIDFKLAELLINRDII